LAVLRHHVVDSDHARIDGCDFEAQQSLREHLFFRKPAQYLVKVANLYAASGRGVRLAAMLTLLPHRFHLVVLRAVCRYFIAKSRGKQLIAQSAKIVLPANLARRAVACVNGGVSISSRYCSFCAAARVATSSADSPVFPESTAENLSNVLKK